MSSHPLEEADLAAVFHLHLVLRTAGKHAADLLNHSTVDTVSKVAALLADIGETDIASMLQQRVDILIRERKNV